MERKMGYLWSGTKTGRSRRKETGRTAMSMGYLWDGTKTCRRVANQLTEMASEMGCTLNGIITGKIFLKINTRMVRKLKVLKSGGTEKASLLIPKKKL